MAGQLQGVADWDSLPEALLAEVATLLGTAAEHLNASQLLSVGPAIQVPNFPAHSLPNTCLLRSATTTDEMK